MTSALKKSFDISLYGTSMPYYNVVDPLEKTDVVRGKSARGVGYLDPTLFRRPAPQMLSGGEEDTTEMFSDAEEVREAQL